jgi:hypothetical protein
MRRRMRMQPSKRGGPIAVSLFAATLALAMVVMAGSPAGAKSSALAHLKVTADSVSIRHKGQTDFADAKDGQALRQGDTIKTDATGKAEIDYTDGSLTRLGVSTVFTISKLTNNQGGRQTQGTLSVGETWNRAAKVSETGSFEVKAGGTTAAVEGTAFVVECPPPAAPTDDMQCKVTAVVDNVQVDSDAWDVTSVTDAP